MLVKNSFIFFFNYSLPCVAVVYMFIGIRMILIFSAVKNSLYIFIHLMLYVNQNFVSISKLLYFELHLFYKFIYMVTYWIFIFFNTEMISFLVCLFLSAIYTSYYEQFTICIIHLNFIFQINIHFLLFPNYFSSITSLYLISIKSTFRHKHFPFIFTAISDRS